MLRPPLLVVLAVLLSIGVAPMALAGRAVRPLQAFVPGATHGDRIPPNADRALRRQLARIRAARRSKARASATGNQLAAGPWCGAETSTDNTTNQANSGARIKVIYAYPNDRPNRFLLVRDFVQTDARDMTDALLGVPGSAKTLRFDVGTACGPGYVDVMSVQLPRATAAYTSVSAGTRMDRLRTDLAGSVSGMSGTRNYLVYADAALTADGVAGIASVYLDDSPGSGNASNIGGLWAMVFGGASDSDFQSSRLTTALHEVSHNLGAVQDSAPNSTGAGHCTDEADVMCYPDGGPNNVMTSPCAVQAYDCGSNDYFSPAPAPASYLATHWNLYNSTFLCASGTCVGAGGPTTNVTPTARIEVKDTAGNSLVQAVAGVPFRLEGASSSDDVGVADYRWDVGDNGTVEGYTASLPAAFSTAGDYTVRLTVRDALGAAGTVTATVRVGAAINSPPPDIDDEPPVDDALRRDTLKAMRSALVGIRDALHGAARSGRLAVAFSAPTRGRMEFTVTLRGRELARGARLVQAGKHTLRRKLSTSARRRLAAGGPVTVRLRFLPASGAAVVLSQRVTVRR